VPSRAIGADARIHARDGRPAGLFEQHFAPISAIVGVLSDEFESDHRVGRMHQTFAAVTATLLHGLPPVSRAATAFSSYVHSHNLVYI
jgi:hypothetical protein